MATEGFSNASQIGEGNTMPKSAILIIIGEPATDEHKDLILAEITKGFKCWDVEGTGVDINDELAQIANRASLGEEGPNGERLVRHTGENVVVEVLINPQIQTVTSTVKNCLQLAVPNKFLLYAGHAFKGSGDWVIQDGVFTFKRLAHILNDSEVEAALKEQPGATLTMHCNAIGDWNCNISKQEFSKIISLNVNPAEKLDNANGILQFMTYVSSFLKAHVLTDILPASDVIGNIGFNKPTLYIFPGCQGDSALFGIKGFNLLVNAGFNRKACFWDFTRHLDRIDAVLLTHLGTDNLFGISSVLKRKCMENVHPEIGFIYMNGIEKPKSNGTENGNKANSLMINLAEEGSEIVEMSKQLGCPPQACTRGEKAPTLEPVNLYHKVGHGSLDMYILNPVADTKELKDFYQQWTKKVGQFGTHQGFPMPDMFSICALLVWRPSNPNEQITRVLFPGNAPQHKIIEGLEKVKNINVFKHATCTGQDLLKPAAPVKKPGSASSASRVTAKPTAAKPSPAKKESTPTRTPTKSTPRSSPPKTTKPAPKEPAAKKSPAKTKDAGKEKTDKSKTSASSSPSKGSGASSSPAKSITPVATPVEPASPGAVEPLINHLDTAPVLSPAAPVDLSAPAAAEGTDMNGIPSSLPEPISASSVDPAQPSQDYSKQQLADLGIYDEDDDIGAADGSLSVPTQQGSSVDDLEEIPQNLPDPVEVPQLPPQPEMDIRPEEPQEFQEPTNNLLDDSLQSDPDVVPRTDEQNFVDPADDIPSSPEPNFEEHDLPAIPPGRTAPLPTFTNEPDVVPSMDSVQQNIQYGVADDSRVMGGIKEEDEEQEEEDQIPPEGSEQPQNMEDLGIYEDDEGSQDGNDKGDPSAFVYEKDVDMEDERVPEPADSHIPEAFEKDTTPPLQEGDNQGLMDQISSGAANALESAADAAENVASNMCEQVTDAVNGTNGTHDDRDETDSIDGESPEKGMLDMTGKLESPLDQGAGDIPISPVNPDQQFESLQSGGFNPFHGIEGGRTDVPPERAQEFDPETQWGQPMGLPAPPPPAAAAPEKKPAAAAKKPEAKKPSSAPAKRPTSARPSSATTAAKPAPKANGIDKKPEAKKPTTAEKKPATTKTRPASAPASKPDTSKPKSTTARKPASATRSSPVPVKLPPLPALTPFYLDLTYIPNHGDSNYCDVEFFKRVRARHYVLSALTPNPDVLNALLEAKPSWENKDLEVLVIPTYDNETLRHWMGLNKEKLSQLKIDVAPSASRCFIQLQDHEANCSAYRLEF